MSGTRASAPPPVLSDGAVLLRLLEPADVDDIVLACQDPQTVAWTTIPTPYGPDDARTWVAAHTADPAWWDNPTWAITVPPARRFCGGIDLRCDGAGAAEVGYQVAPWARGNGVAERALRLVCAFAFGTLELDVVTWVAFAGNDASRRTAQRVGFDVPDHVFASWAPQRGRRRDSWLGTLVPADLARAARGVDARRRAAGPALTRRELEVLGCLARGSSNQAIADELGIAENTVKNHVRSILEKLPARSRSEAVVVGLRRGLTTLHR